MITIRDARREDHAGYRRLMPELRVPDPVAELEPWWTRQGATTRIAEHDAIVVGYLFYELIGSVFFVRNIVSDPEHRRRGIGRALMQDAEGMARALGATEWQLNVKDDNTPALALYRSLGFAVTRTTHVLLLPWDLVRAGKRVVRPLDPAEDTAIEQAFDLTPGLLDRRRHAGRLLFASLDGDATSGLAVFDPTFPAAYPMIAPDPETAMSLLSAMAAHRIEIDDTDKTWRNTSVQLALQDSASAADALTASGAQLLFRVLSMRAELGPSG